MSRAIAADALMIRALRYYCLFDAPCFRHSPCFRAACLLIENKDAALRDATAAAFADADYMAYAPTLLRAAPLILLL